MIAPINMTHTHTHTHKERERETGIRKLKNSVVSGFEIVGLLLSFFFIMLLCVFQVF